MSTASSTAEPGAEGTADPGHRRATGRAGTPGELDLRDHAEIINLKGDSYRLKHRKEATTSSD